MPKRWKQNKTKKEKPTKEQKQQQQQQQQICKKVKTKQDKEWKNKTKLKNTKNRVRDRFVIYWQNNDLLHPKTMIHSVKDRNSIDSHYKI